MDDRSGCPAAASPTPMQLGELFANPQETLLRHRAEGWWTTLPDLDTDCMALSHDDGRDLLADGEHLDADLLGFILRLLRLNADIAPELIEYYEQSAATFLVLNGEPHRELRRLFARAFTPRQVQQITPFMRATASRLAGEFEPGDDFVAGFAAQFPGLVLCELLSIPADDRHRFVAWVDCIQEAFSAERLLTMSRDESLAILDAERALDGYTRELMASRRDEPGDDLISRLVNDPECPIDDAQVAVSIGALIFGGNDTTRCALGLLMVAMAEHPDLWERLAVDDTFAEPVIEETLRWQGPVAAVSRVVSTPLARRDVELATSDHAAVSLWSANRDERAYENADRFDPDRWTRGAPGHLAFGHGPHYCLGASLAREELRIAAVALAGRMTDLRVMDLEMRPFGGIQGPARLHLDFAVRI